MVEIEDTITEAEVVDELEDSDDDPDFTLEQKKERVLLINEEIKKLLGERDELEREIDLLIEDETPELD